MEPALRQAGPGVPLYRSFGFVATRDEVLMMPDGVSIGAKVMERPVDPVRVAST